MVQAEPTDIASIDKGYHNFYSVVRWTGQLDSKGERVFDKRFVRKKWYDRHAGRSKKRKRAAFVARRAQALKLLDRVTQHSLKTVDANAFRLAIEARRDSYAALHALYNNRRCKKLKLAMRAREQRAIEQVINYISWGGTVLNVIGDCSKTTGFRSSTPGGPLLKIERLMVKKGLRTCEEKEAYSSKSSVCCHGYRNHNQRNGQPLATYKKGKYLATPGKMPREVHGILICNKCGRTWDRDVVGAINILDIYLARMRGQQRPERFTRGYWS